METAVFIVIFAAAIFILCLYLNDLIRAIDDVTEALDGYTKFVINEKHKKRKPYGAKKEFRG